MDELILRYLGGRATDIEARTLERWRAESTENERRYRISRRAWLLTAPEPSVEHTPPPAERVVAAAERRRRRRRLGRAVAAGSGYAATAVALLALGWVALGRTEVEPHTRFAPVESSASAGDVVTMSLSDGSIVRLAASTTLEFPIADSGREVVLRGRAFFAVAAAETPFRVRTPLGHVTVVGTRFEVSATDEELRVVVVEGSVSATTGALSMPAEAGQVVRMTGSGAAEVSSDENIWSLLDWSEGLLVFQATPLSSVAEELERHFGREVIVAEALRQRRITAWFGDEAFGEVMDAVCLIAGARCEHTERTVTIGR